MERLHNGFTLELSQGSFPFSTDSMLLSGFVKLPKQAAVLDLGSGCGTLGLLLCARDPNCRVTGVELDEDAHRMALENSRRNGLGSRLNSICADLGNIPSLLPPGSFSCCISNPPYFSGGPKSQAAPLARRQDRCSFETLFASAAWALQYGGDFFLVHRPERLAEIFFQASQVHLEPKRLCLVRHRQGGSVTLVLIQCRKGAKPGLRWEELCLFDSQEQPTAYYRKLYHL